jgi:hypothetical protein
MPKSPTGAVPHLPESSLVRFSGQEAALQELLNAALEAAVLANPTKFRKLALKAQSQCRATLETLAAIKHPQPITFVRQANVAHGPQQVNNSTPSTAESTRARELENAPNELLEQHGNQRLDAREAENAV